MRMFLLPLDSVSALALESQRASLEHPGIPPCPRLHAEPRRRVAPLAAVDDVVRMLLQMLGHSWRSCHLMVEGSVAVVVVGSGVGKYLDQSKMALGVEVRIRIGPVGITAD